MIDSCVTGCEPHVRFGRQFRFRAAVVKVILRRLLTPQAKGIHNRPRRNLADAYGVADFTPPRSIVPCHFIVCGLLSILDAFGHRDAFSRVTS